MDVDIDFVDREAILRYIDHIPAAIRRDGQLVKHNTGIYAQAIPYNPLTATANIDHHTAEERGYFKIDMLNVGAYSNIQDEQHLLKLMDIEPVWELLETKDVCDQLFHVNGHHSLLAMLKPRTVEELAMLLAIIRPAKRYLADKVVSSGWNSIEPEVWSKPMHGEYYWKKAHAISYAFLVVVQLNLLCQNINS